MGWGGDGKGYGKSWGGGGKGGGWGSPMSWSPYGMKGMKGMDKGVGKGMKGFGKGTGLRSFSNATKVWIGGLPADSCSTDLNKQLKAHMETAGGKCLYAEVGKSGSGGAAFKTK